MTEITIHNVTDVYLMHQKRTDSGTWVEVEIQSKDGDKITLSLWAVREKSINFHMGDEE